MKANPIHRSVRSKLSRNYPRLIALAAICLVATSSAGVGATQETVTAAAPRTEYNYMPKDGLVPTKDVAIRMAEVILKPIYGDRVIDAELPLTATLTAGGVWKVRGTFKKPAVGHRMGGVAEIWISKKDAQVVRVLHGE